MQVVARIIGGLGNQMFIYATARALALRIDADLILDTQSGYKMIFLNEIFYLILFVSLIGKQIVFRNMITI
ncbi:hypothetical protein ACIXST_10255 [Bacteroides fragilis]|nr:hypothetical protein [Bacteroides fragilis]